MLRKSLTSIVLASSLLLSSCASMGNREVEDKSISTAFISCSNRHALADCEYTPNSSISGFDVFFKDYSSSNTDRKEELRIIVQKNTQGKLRKEIIDTLDILDDGRLQYNQIDALRTDYNKLFDTNQTNIPFTSTPYDT